MTMRFPRLLAWALPAVFLALLPPQVRAQEAPPVPGTRVAEIAARQAEKARATRPYTPKFIEHLIQEVDEHLAARHVRWHPYYGHAYPGAGLTGGLGYKFHTRDYDSLDVRASVSLTRSKRAEVQYEMPRLLRRRGTLTALGGWSEGLGQAFYGIGIAGTSTADRADFDFRRSFGSVGLEFRPLHGALRLGGGVEVSRYEQRRDAGSAFALRYAPGSLPGVGATIDYVQSQGQAVFDWRPARGYARRGGAYGVTARRYTDPDERHSFDALEYDVVQHIPVMRDAWVLSLHARAETTFTSGGNTVPFFMLPTLGNANTLRAYANQRFRDRHSLLMSAEWRVLVNRFTDLAFFYDAGKVAARRSDLDLSGLRDSYGIGLRLHTLETTPVRVDFARGREGFRVALAAVAAF